MPNLADRRASAEYSCTTCTGPSYSQGLETYRVPFALYDLNRARLTEAMLAEIGANARGVILLEGGRLGLGLGVRANVCR